MPSRTALITGAGRGIGRTLALRLASKGITVVAVSRTQADLDSLCAEIGERGGTAHAVAADTGREDEVARLKSYAPDILINNAGATLRKKLEDISLEEWHSILAVNLTGPFLLCRAFVPGMIERGFGRIINLSSVTAHTPAPARAAYAAAKAGVFGFTRALALELAAHGITVNTVSPGTFPTRMTAAVLDEPVSRQSFLSRIPVGRFGKLGEVAALIEFLCSDEAAFITGADLRIDGGWTAQ